MSKQILEDNARKFIVSPLDKTYLEKNSTASYVLAVDWIETSEDSEKKVAHRTFDDGHIQILLIAKVTHDGKRSSEKREITDAEYRELLKSSVLHLEKKRYEYTIAQNGISFAVKYDEFANSDLCMAEVDASTEEERDSFNPDNFPGILSEVTGDMRYYGYRVQKMI